MPAHWEWAFDQLSSFPSFTHATVLTDRMIFKRHALDRMIREVSSPDTIVTYNIDTVDDYSRPVKVQCPLWSGATFEVGSGRLLELCSIMDFPPALPKMLNSLVPMGHLEAVRSRFGSLFASVAPDYCFAYRTLSLIDSVRYIDECLLVNGSLARSNGASYSRGESSTDHADFVAKLGGRSLNPAAPVPAFATTTNTMASEYELIRLQTENRKFPPLDLEAYFRRIEFDVARIQAPDVKGEMKSLLYDGPDAPLPKPRSVWLVRLEKLVSRGPRYMSEFVVGAIIAARPTKALWRRAGARPPQTRWFRFRDADEAFDFVQSPGRRPVRTHRDLKVMQARSTSVRSG